MEKKKADNKTTIGTVVLAIFILFAAVLLFGMFSDTNSTSTKIDEPMVSRNEAHKSAFIGGCNSNGKMIQYCTCVWNKIDAKYTDSQIDTIGSEYAKTNKWPESFSVFINECIQSNLAELESV